MALGGFEMSTFVLILQFVSNPKTNDYELRAICFFSTHRFFTP